GGDHLGENHPLNLVNTYKDEIFHFAQGALLSAFTLFFFKSASLSVSLVFMLFMIGLLFINELPFFQKLGSMVKGTLLALTFFSFCLVYLPLLMGEVGTLVFALSCIMFCLLMGAFSYFLIKKGIDKTVLKKSWIQPGGILLLAFLLLRTVGFIPPVPLSLETAGIYRKVEKKYPEYHLTFQKEWWRFWNSTAEFFRYQPGQKLYFFTRVFAPGGFKDKIIVHWQKKVDGSWETSDKIPLTISGGRNEGFRGYAYKNNYSDGDWRILVETKAGSEIGRLNFEVAPAESDYDLEDRIKIDK
ncbi:MAG: DUF2914 domain-containing protein, partial [Halobacteriovoraceae bacterium]|nr:DUF2914 domain-containing protein [Halobacteriovoraceae bacterium]